MMKLLLAIVLLALTAELSHQATPFNPFGADVYDPPRITNPIVGDMTPGKPFLPTGPFVPTRPGKTFDPFQPIVSKRGDGNVDIGVEKGPQGVQGTVSGTYKTDGGTTFKGHVSHGSGGTSGGISVSIPIQG